MASEFKITATMGTPKTNDAELAMQRADWVRELARVLVRDEHEAEDLAQDAWVVALTHSPREEGKWTHWIGATLRNLTRARWRSDRRREARERETARPESESSHAEMLERLEAHEVLLSALRALDEPYRSTIMLRYLEGLAPREIAARERVAVKTVHTRLMRGLSQLREQLDHRHGGDRRAWLALLSPLARPKHVVVAGAVAVGIKTKITLALAVLATVLWFAQDRNAESGDDGQRLDPMNVDARVSESEQPPPEVAGRIDVSPPTELASAPPSSSRGGTADAEVRIVGSVVDAHDLPIANVRVVAREREPAASECGSSLTDGDGAFEFDLSNAADRIDVEAPGWCVVLCPRVSRVVGMPHVFVLAPRRRVAGQVLDSAGAALADVELRLVPPSDLRASIERVLDLSIGESWSGSSDDSGTFDFAAAPDLEGCELLARAPGFEDARVALALGDHVDVRVVLAPHTEPFRHVVGRVVDAHGAPIEGAFVGFEDMADAQRISNEAARTDARGRFDLPLESDLDGPRTLVALAVGRAPVKLDSGWDALERCLLWPETLELVLTDSALSIAGRVLRADGSPAVGVRVTHLDATLFPFVPVATFSDGSTSWKRWKTEELLRGADAGEVVADELGRFVLGGLLRKDYRLQIFDPRTLDLVVTPPLAAGSRDVEARFATSERFDRIAGRVIDSFGSPVANAHVRLERWAEFDRHEGPALASDEVTTDASGRFEFTAVARAARSLRVRVLDQLTATETALAAIEDLEQVVLTVRVLCNFKIDRSASSLDAASFAVLDENGEAILISESKGTVGNVGTRMPLGEKGSSTLLASDRGMTLVFYDSKGVEVSRMPLRLRPGSLTIVRP